MKKIIFLFLILAVLFISCYITPETENENGAISLRIPASSLPQREIGSDEAGLIAIITNIDLEAEVDESYFSNPENALYINEVTISPTDEDLIMSNYPVQIRLENVPEGDRMYIFLMYLGSETYYNPFGIFYSETPFSIKKGETTYIELEIYVYEPV